MGIFLFIVLLSSKSDLNVNEIYARAGENKKEVKAFVEKAEKKGYKDWAYFLLKAMPDVDLANLKSKQFIDYLDAVKLNKDRIPWTAQINDELFYYYILPYRVSQEALEDFTAIYKDTLYNLIKNTNSMRDAALKINEWVYTKMDYKSTESWDQNATTTIKRGFGRCEEMSILLIKALRTVCIPAREVYTPAWPFTNSNHAWTEAWVDGKWYSIGAGELTDLDGGWFLNSAKRAVIIKGVAYGRYNCPPCVQEPTLHQGKMEQGAELFDRKENGFTVINVTKNYTEQVNITVRVFEDELGKVPAESANVSLSVYNNASITPVAEKKTDEKGEANFIVGETELFVYASKGLLKNFCIKKPVNNDTIVLKLNDREIPDSFFWLHTVRPQAIASQTNVRASYKPNVDSLNALKQVHFKEIRIDSAMSISPKRLFSILDSAKGNYQALLGFYKKLPSNFKLQFIDYCEALNAKDLVEIDTSYLMESIRYSILSKRLAKGYGIPDSLYKKYVLPDRICFENIRGWRSFTFKKFSKFRRTNGTALAALFMGSKLTPDIDSTVRAVFNWVDKNVKKNEEPRFFGPLMNPEDVLVIKRCSDIEKDMLVVGALRALGIPSRMGLNYKGAEYWNKKWKDISSYIKNNKSVLTLKFTDYNQDVTSKMSYGDNYSITDFAEAPSELDISEDSSNGLKVLAIDKGIHYVVTGWRNGYGDAYVKLTKFEAGEDTLRLNISTEIPVSGIKQGDMLVRDYNGLDLSSFGIKNEELNQGDVLIIVFDTESEASKSTLKALSLKDFSGKVYLFAVTGLPDTNSNPEPERSKWFRGAENLIKECGLTGSLFIIDEDTYKKWGISSLPSILYLRDGKALFWVDGLFLNASSLIESLQ